MPTPPIPQRKPTQQKSSAFSGIASALGTFAGGPVGSVVGSIAGDLIGGIFGGNDGPGFQAQLNDQRIAYRDMERQRFGEMARAAKVYGYHPLAMLGVNPSSGSTVHNSAQQEASNMGQNIGRAVQSYFSGERQKQLEDLAIKREYLKNELLEAQITNINRQPGDAPAPVVQTKTSDVTINRESKASPRHNFMVNADGSVTRVLNTEQIGDNDALMVYDMLIHTLPDELSNMVKRDVKKLSRAGRITEQNLRGIVSKYKHKLKKKPYSKETKHGYSQIYWN